jgi:hypothetical protein
MYQGTTSVVLKLCAIQGFSSCSLDTHTDNAGIHSRSNTRASADTLP